jgi:hypothetical protein
MAIASPSEMSEKGEGMQISSTTYMKFLISTGTPRVAVVREARRHVEDGYAQGSDYYRGVREGTIDILRAGRHPVELDAIIEDAIPARRENYRACVDGLRKWMGRQGIVWTRRPTPKTWRSGELEVRINPELLVTVDGKPHRVKLYLPAKPVMNQRRANLLIHLLKMAGDDGSANVSILDSRKSRLFSQTFDSPDFDVLLEAEAMSFTAMWHAVGAQGGRRQRHA